MSESREAAIARFSAMLAGKAAEVDARFANAYRASDVYPDLDRAWKIASEMAATARDSWKLPDDEIEGIALALLEQRAFYSSVIAGKTRAQGIPPEHVFAPGSSFSNSARDAMKAPLIWLRGVGVPQLSETSSYLDTLEAAKNIPSATIKWTLEQVLKSLGIPPQVLPVVIMAGLFGVGFYAYKVSETFKPFRARS